MIKNIIYFGISIIVFFGGVISYGVILNIREVSLAEAMEARGITELNQIHLSVDKKNFKLDLYSDSILVKTYKIVCGRNIGPVKNSPDDNVTPIGTFNICSIDTSELYHKFIAISYPAIENISEFYKNGVISKAEYEKFSGAISEDGCLTGIYPEKNKIGLHGIGKYNSIFKNLPFVFNWTNGSIALSNENIDELCGVTKIGTPIEIKY